MNSGTFDFEDVIESIPLGPVKVTLRLKRNEANPHTVAAYVGNRQVGWLSTDWSTSDPYVAWIMRFDAARIRPRFEGGKLTEITKTRLIYFYVPGRDDEDLPAIADRLIASG